MHTKNTWVVGVTVLVIGFLSGHWLGSHGGSLTGDSLAAQVQKLQDKIERARKFLPPMAEHLSTISGNVKSVTGNQIVLEATVFNPLEDLPPIRTITVTGATTITKIEQRKPATYQKERAAYVSSPASLKDITPGKLIQVTAGEDITSKESFEAKAIQIVPSAPRQ